MRKLLLALLLSGIGASAQTAPMPPPSSSPPTAAAASSALKSDWVHVQVLHPGTRVHIKTIGHGSIRCTTGAVDGDSLTCGGVVFQRSTILYIKSSHKLRSTLVGVALGYGSAFALTIAYAESCKLNCRVGTAAAIVLIDVGLLVATPIVFGIEDLTAGTIYRAPGA